VAVVTDEARVVVALLHVVRTDVVVVVSARRDPRRQVGEDDVRVAPNAAALDQAIVPVVAPRDVLEVERAGGGDGE
jgi:hypothetical protein